VAYGLLYDLWQMTGAPTLAMLKDFAPRITLRPEEPARGRVAMLTTDPTLYTLACTYALTGQALRHD
jgi:hypothetical protein